MHRLFIFQNSIDNPPCRVIGEKFTNCINLIKSEDHYNLVVSSEKQKISRGGGQAQLPVIRDIKNSLTFLTSD